MNFGRFESASPGLLGRRPFPQREGLVWAGLSAFLQLLQPDAMLAVFVRQPSIRACLMQHVATHSLSPTRSSGDAQQGADTALSCAHAALRVCLQVRHPSHALCRLYVQLVQRLRIKSEIALSACAWLLQGLRWQFWVPLGPAQVALAWTPISAAKMLADGLLCLPDRGDGQHGRLLCDSLRLIVTTGVEAAQMQGAHCRVPSRYPR